MQTELKAFAYKIYIEHERVSMRNIIRTLIVSAIFLTFGSMQVFATNNNVNTTQEYAEIENIDPKKGTYKEQATAIRNEISVLTSQIKELREYNLSVSTKLTTIIKNYKKDKNIISKDTLKKAKELRKTIKDIEKPEKTVSEDTSIKTLIQNKEYDKALIKLNETLEYKKEQLIALQEKSAIWHQIDALIG